jgi:Tfp pilus assembly protein PilF
LLKEKEMSALKIGMVVLAFAALMSLPQSAGATSPASPAADDVGYRAIVSRDWSTAEQQLLAGLEKDPTNVFRQLNLAWVYAQTGRKDEAAMIYRKILMADQDLVAAVPSGEGRSVKLLAERGLSLVQGSN